ncbi:hypothetical protein OBBRIDRAFT_804252 [Obba rivulosa]|uniref:Uncharacterized protein n=1 Tax=Obba rivulosa TaxID=1052685 RepID=A0A8E2AXL5_9APHY|nr:hypothetical protein OBBRIDRAFT_804252 [Obba rivulosa]
MTPTAGPPSASLADPEFASGEPAPRSTRTERRSSRDLVISPNLYAALEFDERVRAACTPAQRLPPSPALVPGGGLPPPPRRKSRVRSPPDSPNPLASTSAASPPSIPLPEENPYINPAPRLSYLLQDRTARQGHPDPDPEGKGQGTVHADSDRGHGRPETTSRLPPPGPAARPPDSPSRPRVPASAQLPATAPHSPPSTTDGHAHGPAQSQSLPTSPSLPVQTRPAFKSHRYWASLHRVERMLGLGRRLSTELPEGAVAESSGSTSRERGKEKEKRAQEKARVPASAPSSPVVQSMRDADRRGSISSTTSASSRGERALAALSPRARLGPYIAETDAVALAADGGRGADGSRSRRGGSMSSCGRDGDSCDAAGRQAASGTATAGRHRRQRAEADAETATGSHGRQGTAAANGANANFTGPALASGLSRVSPQSQSVSPRTSGEASSVSVFALTKSNMSMSTCDTSVHPHSSDSRDPRISISSTIYPTESQASYDVHDPTHAPSPPRRRPLPSPPTQTRRSSSSGRPNMSRSPDRESFIDFASPTSPDYPHPYTSIAQSMSAHDSYAPSSYSRAPSSSADHRGSSEYQNRYDPRTAPEQRSNTDPVRSSTRPQLTRLEVSGQKPPIPTAPKPHFRRSRSAQPPAENEQQSHDAQASAHPASAYPHTNGSKPDLYRNLAGELARGLPPTTNLLNPRERAEGVRKTRKLTQLFGQTPGAALAAGSDPEADADDPLSGCLPAPKGMNLAMKRRHQKGAASMLEVVTAAAGAELGAMNWPPTEADGPPAYLALGPRRHSSPMSAGEFAFVVDGRRGEERGDGGARASQETWRSGESAGSRAIEIGSQEGEPSGEWEGSATAQYGAGENHRSERRSGEKRGSGVASLVDVAARRASGASSPTSFIDLSDDEGQHPATSRGRHARPAFGHHHAFSDSPLSTPRPGAGFAPGTPSVLSLSAEDAAEDERRRKRERLAKLHRFLGSRVPPHLVLGLDPADDLPPPAPEPPAMHDDDERRVRVRRRRSSSAAEFARSWSDEIDRLKEDLNDREKAINVRRAVKMEKMFGVAPPQTLYHTRQVASSPGAPAALWEPASPRAASPRVPFSGLRNVNQSPYRSKGKKASKDGRPGTSDSTKPLIATGVDGDRRDEANQRMSDVYLHYQHSLNSLNDIIDRDDKQSLAELHDYLSGTLDPDDAPIRASTSSASGDLLGLHSPTLSISSSTGTIKSERRRSLPSRTSLVSLASEFSIASSADERTGGDEFQQRRRRAAKLTAFFGVNYRDLMGEILDSIEKGLEEERGRGTLGPDEAQDLLQRLMKLKSKRNSLS